VSREPAPTAPRRAQSESEREVELDPSIAAGSRVLDWERISRPANVFVTGPTTFVGAHLLQALVEQTEARVHCLLDAPTAVEARRRLRDAAARYHVELPEERIEPVLGDLSRSLLGLGESAFTRLAEQIDAIYHNGAVVRHLADYAQLEPVNVFGTHET